MKQIIFYIALVLGFSSCSYSSKAHSEYGSWYIGNNVGASFFNTNESSRIGTGPGWPDDLYLHQDIDTSVLLSLAGGYTWITHQPWLPFFSVGASLTHQFPVIVSGQILEYSLPQFSNYRHHFKIQSTTLLATVKGTIFRYGHLTPYLSAGIGSAFNRATAYKETPLNPRSISRLSPDFQNKTSQHFSYQLGIGMDYILQKNLWVGVGYQYNHLGRIETASGRAGFSAEYLKAKLASSNVVFNINYYFNQVEH